MKNEANNQKEEEYYRSQQDRIILYMKYNIKSFKSIKFTGFEKDPMGGYAIRGYINNNKELSFTASTYADEDNQFEGDYSSTEKFDEMMIENPKTVSEIKKE